MNPQEMFCPNMDCPARGQTGKGNIHVHSQKEKRFICDVCQGTFPTSKGTIFYRLRQDPKTVLCVIILLAYGCPLQAIVKAFDLDERSEIGMNAQGNIVKVSMSSLSREISKIYSKCGRMTLAPHASAGESRSKR